MPDRSPSATHGQRGNGPDAGNGHDPLAGIEFPFHPSEAPVHSLKLDTDCRARMQQCIHGGRYLWSVQTKWMDPVREVALSAFRHTQAEWFQQAPHRVFQAQPCLHEFRPRLQPEYTQAIAGELTPNRRWKCWHRQIPQPP